MQKNRIILAILASASLGANAQESTDWIPHGAGAEPSRTGVLTLETPTGKMEVPYGVFDNLAVAEGDIVLGNADELDELSIFGTGTVALSRLWPGGVVPYVVSGSLPNQARITSAIAHWEARTGIRFVRRTTQRDYVSFIVGTGCSSAVGRVGGVQYVRLASGCGTGTVIHEIGHAVGLWHEQSRTDRDQFVSVLWGNIQSSMAYNFNIFGSASGRNIGIYDYNSVMHYGGYSFSSNGRATLVRRDNGSPTLSYGSLSAGDISAVGELYATPTFNIARQVSGIHTGSFAVRSPGSHVSVARNAQGRIMHRTLPGGSWQVDSSGVIASDPVAMGMGNGLVGTVSLDSVGGLWYRPLTANGFGTWTRLGNRLRGTPALASTGRGDLHVFVRYEDGKIWRVSLENGTWGGWTRLNAVFHSDPVAVANTNGRIDLFSRSSIGTLERVTLTGTQEGQKVSLGGNISSNPSAILNAGNTEVYAAGQSNVLVRYNQNRNSWETLGGILAEPQALADGNKARIYGRALNNTLWIKEQK